MPEHEISDFEAETPVQIRRADTEVQQRYRRNRASAQLRAMKDKIGGLDNELLANLLWSEIADRREREERAATAQLERERAQMARDAEDARTARDLRKSGAAYRAKIILALIGLIGTALTAYFAGRAGV